MTRTKGMPRRKVKNLHGKVQFPSEMQAIWETAVDRHVSCWARDGWMLLEPEEHPFTELEVTMEPNGFIKLSKALFVKARCTECIPNHDVIDAREVVVYVAPGMWRWNAQRREFSRN